MSKPYSYNFMNESSRARGQNQPSNRSIQQGRKLSSRDYLKILASEGPQLTPFNDLCSALGINSTYYNLETHRLVTNYCEQFGYNLLPDIRLPQIFDTQDFSKVVVYATSVTLNEKSSPEFFLTRALVLTVATLLKNLISKQDSKFKTLERIINYSPKLKPTEKNALSAYIYWIVTEANNLFNPIYTFYNLESTNLITLRIFFNTLDQANFTITKQEINALENIYDQLGLDTDWAQEDLNILVNKPVPYKARDKAADKSIYYYIFNTLDSVIFYKYDIDKTEIRRLSGLDKKVTNPKPKPKPAPIKSKNELCLDEKLIKIKESETSKVRLILNDIFNSDRADTPAHLSKNYSQSQTKGLDQPHSDLLRQLMTQENWERSYLAKICRDYNLMLDGALEVINEWAIKLIKVPIIEDSDPIFFNLSLAKEMI
ncbi:MAG: hypothetical protein LBV23_11185 [Deltaproteobacteria bacterium]|jgi:hypothetical protein|nr:hypothetical protein [Deltaproteobacteria bacterium]